MPRLMKKISELFAIGEAAEQHKIRDVIAMMALHLDLCEQIRNVDREPFFWAVENELRRRHNPNNNNTGSQI